MSEELTIQLDSDIRTRLAALARSQQRSEALLVAEAVAAYVEHEDWIAKQVEETLKRADSPDAKWVSHNEVKAWLDSWDTLRMLGATELKPRIQACP